MTSHDAETLHAPGERCSDEVLKKQMDYLSELPYFKQGLDATKSMILILNTCRQAVFANKAFLATMNMQKSSELAGQRPGEIIKCINACDAINGCGTAEACKYCNGVNTILKAMENNEESSGEFSNINTRNGYEQNVNLSIHVTPLEVNEEMFYVVTVNDNSGAVGKRLLERTFFHDVINTAGALKGIVGLLKGDVPDIIKSEVEFVEETFKSLVEEIQAQKYLMDAENNELALEITSVETTDILKSVNKLYEGHDVAVNKIIKLDSHCASKNIRTDHRLLRRVLGNMIKNALEASDEGGVVTLGCSMEEDKRELITLWVHNDQYMDDRAQNLVFHRSFSTRGAGRGVGTYSMKLFGEIFLQGKVGFSTDKDKGTRFYIKLPLQQVASE
ncbi:MAG: histidine kinase [Firmicutes bacterium]|nr:histidine kinase [Bacillota bacterium]